MTFKLNFNIIFFLLFQSIVYCQDNSQLKISLFIEEQISNEKIIELLHSKGFTKKNLKKVDLNIYNFDIISNRSKIDFDGIQIDVITKSRDAICSSCEILKDLIKTSLDKKVYLIKSIGYNSECLNPMDYELFPETMELNSILKKEKKLSKNIGKQLIVWYPKNTVTIKEITVNNNMKPLQIDNGQEIKIDFFLSSSNLYQEFTWTNEYNSKFRELGVYENGYNTVKFKPTSDSKYCLNYLLHNYCQEKICTDFIKVDNVKKSETIINNRIIELEKIPMIKQYVNNGKTIYILNEMEDGIYGAKYIVSLESGSALYNFIVPKQEGIEEYKLEITKLHFHDKPNTNAQLDLYIDKEYNDEKYTKLVLKQFKLYGENETNPVSPTSFLQYEIENEGGVSKYFIESEISIIPTKLKKGYSYKYGISESVRVIFQLCNN
jgi:hypothetical protein